MCLTTPGQDLMDLVRTEDLNRPLHKLLNFMPRAFLGVDANALAVLEKLEIKTILDLATQIRLCSSN